MTSIINPIMITVLFTELYIPINTTLVTDENVMKITYNQVTITTKKKMLQQYGVIINNGSKINLYNISCIVLFFLYCCVCGSIMLRAHSLQ